MIIIYMHGRYSSYKTLRHEWELTRRLTFILANLIIILFYKNTMAWTSWYVPKIVVILLLLFHDGI